MTRFQFAKALDQLASRLFQFAQPHHQLAKAKFQKAKPRYQQATTQSSLVQIQFQETTGVFRDHNQISQEVRRRSHASEAGSEPSSRAPSAS